MNIVYSGQANVLTLTIANRNNVTPIIAGTVNMYLKALTGDDAGKWYKGSDGTWDAAEQIAGAATHSSDGHWQLSLPTAVWTNNVAYSNYAKETGDLHIPVDQDVLAAPFGGSILGGANPLTLTVLKNHLKVDFDDDDDLITQLGIAATEYCQNFQNRIYVNATQTMVLDNWLRIICPPWSPLVTVDSITYVDTDGATQTLNASLYRVDNVNAPGRITEAWNTNYPDIRQVTNAITITYTAGYGAGGDVPDDVKNAIKLLVGSWYEYREDATEMNLNESPTGVKALLWPNRVLF